MALSDPKRTFITRMRLSARDLARVLMEAEDIYSVFYDRAYDDAGIVSDEDLEDWDITRADVMAFIDCCEQLVNLRDNALVSEGDWGAAINRIRDS